jgi:hypothetical protein
MPSGCQIFSCRYALGLEPSYLGISAEPPDRTCKRCRCSCSLISPWANSCVAIRCGESSAGEEEEEEAV